MRKHFVNIISDIFGKHGDVVLLQKNMLGGKIQKKYDRGENNIDCFVGKEEHAKTIQFEMVSAFEMKNSNIIK